MSVNIAVGAAAPTVVEVNGESLIFSPISYYDMGQFENWMREQFEVNSFNALDRSRITDPEEKDRIRNQMFKASHELSFSCAEARGYINSIEGLVQLAYLSLRKTNKDVTPELVAAFFNDLDALREVVRKVFSISGMIEFRIQKGKTEEETEEDVEEARRQKKKHPFRFWKSG